MGYDCGVSRSAHLPLSSDNGPDVQLHYGSPAAISGPGGGHGRGLSDRYNVSRQWQGAHFGCFQGDH